MTQGKAHETANVFLCLRSYMHAKLLKTFQIHESIVHAASSMHFYEVFTETTSYTYSHAQHCANILMHSNVLPHRVFVHGYLTDTERTNSDLQLQ